VAGKVQTGANLDHCCRPKRIEKELLCAAPDNHHRFSGDFGQTRGFNGLDRRGFTPKPSAHEGRDHAHLFCRHPQRLSQLALHAKGGLSGSPDRQFAVFE
jgi:hypothetical protein